MTRLKIQNFVSRITATPMAALPDDDPADDTSEANEIFKGGESEDESESEELTPDEKLAAIAQFKENRKRARAATPIVDDPPDPSDTDDSEEENNIDARIELLKKELVLATGRREKADQRLAKKEQTMTKNMAALDRAREVFATLKDTVEALAGAEQAAREELEAMQRRAREVRKGAGPSGA